MEKKTKTTIAEQNEIQARVIWNSYKWIYDRKTLILNWEAG